MKRPDAWLSRLRASRYLTPGAFSGGQIPSEMRAPPSTTGGRDLSLRCDLSAHYDAAIAHRRNIHEELPLLWLSAKRCEAALLASGVIRRALFRAPCLIVAVHAHELDLAFLRNLRLLDVAQLFLAHCLHFRRILELSQCKAKTRHGGPEATAEREARRSVC